MIYHFILNPKSGKKRRYRHLEDTIKKACAVKKIECKIHHTYKLGDVAEYIAENAKATDEKQRFIAIGGDGTLNTLVNSAPENPNVEFGVIPAGTGNLFSQSGTVCIITQKYRNIKFLSYHFLNRSIFEVDVCTNHCDFVT